MVFKGFLLDIQH